MRNGLDAIEAELAGHAIFGDTREILDRSHSFSLLILQAAPPNRPIARALCQELRTGRHRPATAHILADPIVMEAITDLLDAIRHGGDFPPDESEDVFAAGLRHLRNGLPGLPTAVGCALRVPLDCGAPAMVLYNPDVPESIFKRRFESIFTDYFGGPDLSMPFRRPKPAFVDAVRQGCDLLELILPTLGRDALANIRLIGIPFDSWLFDCATTPSLLSSVFLSTRVLDSPWETAEALFHEALHCKLKNLSRSRSIYPQMEDGTDRAPTIRAVWRRDMHGNSERWSVNRALDAFHVYVHLVLFFRRIERSGDATSAFGAPPASRFRTAFDRANYLSRELAAVEGMFGPYGRTLIAWLSQTLLRLSDAGPATTSICDAAGI